VAVVAPSLDLLVPAMKTQLTLLAAALLAACAPGPVEPVAATAERGSSPLEAAFEDAAAEYQVPVAVLKGIAYVETRVNPASERSASGGRGLMQLAHRADWDMLSRAAALTGVDATTLERDPAANLRGAAAALRELADKSFADDGSLDARDPADFFYAVSLYAGLVSAADGNDYAAQVYGTVERGFRVERAGGSVVQAPKYFEWRRRAPAALRRDAVKQYPAAYTWVGSPNYSAGRTSYTYVVIHTTQGGYSGAVSWLANPSAQVSAHYVVRSSDGQITQMVENENTAWHAQCYNAKSIGIEHEGFIADPGTWYTDAMYTESAKLTRWLTDRHGITRDRAHIIGHNEVIASCNTGGHTDPGPGWNWTKYMGLVNGSTPTPTTGVLTGAIYTGGNTANRVSGAVVTVGTSSVTTGADGLYQFVLAPGTYTANVAKSGFSSNTVSRAVSASATTWGSMEITAGAAVQGALKGKVFITNPADALDMSQPIAGATVTAGGQTQTSDATGMFAFTLPLGTYTVAAAKAGYASKSVSRAVTAAAIAWGSVGLTPSTGADTQAPQLAITFPADNAALDLALVTLAGTATDDRGPVGSVSLKVNGGAASTALVTGGAFSQAIKLAPGLNTLVVSATDAAGNVGSVATTATFNAGASGFAHLAEDEATRLPGLTVELREAGTGALVATAVTNASGAFSLDVTAAPKDYVLVARGAGFLTHSETVSVPDDARLSLKLPMNAGQDPVPGEVGLSFTDPQDGATVSSQTVVVRGAVVGMELAAVTVNSTSADLLGQGQFTAIVPLVEGTNVLEAVATGTQGETVTGKLTVIRKTPGLAGAGQSTGATGCGCTGLPGSSLCAFLLAAPLLRRRRK
jgi:N-acetyl-anhydromuramyl-L-alanine amidase AmpD